MYDILAEYHINMIFRMLVSCLCGMIIGFEDLIQAYTSADVRLNPSRMAQGIVTGVGFSAADNGAVK